MTPDSHTNQELFVEVGDGHELYVHDWGNKDASQVIFFLHGGPGDGCKDRHKLLFDPARQRVIFHDQRGAGRSLPYGSLDDNTTQDLVDDITKIAGKLSIARFIVTGGSWGSTLALAYALHEPERVTAMVLDGIFTGSQPEIDWINNGLFRSFFPDVWERYVASVPAKHRHDPSSYHIHRLLKGDDQAQKASGLAYETLEGSIMKLDDRPTPDSLEEYDPTAIRIEAHYLANTCFMPDRFILDNAAKLTMPIWLIQGRYDMVCPPCTAYELHQSLPNSELIWTTSGHASEHETWTLKRALLLQLSQGC